MEIQRKDYPQAGFEVYGTGEIGDKARQLLAKTPILRGVGFHTPRRVVLAQDFFDPFFQANSIGRDVTDAGVGVEAERRIASGVFPDHLRPLLGSLAVRFGDVPVMVRSSAVGDSRGTGVYRSEVSDPNPGSFEASVKNVLASYVSESASEWRRRSGAGEGMAVMIEPMAGQLFEDEYMRDVRYFAPAISGYGYTSTARGGSYLYVVPGFGSGVERRDGDRITARELDRYEDDIEELFMGRFDNKAVATLQAGRGFSYLYPSGQAYKFPDKYIDRGSIEDAQVVRRGVFGRDLQLGSRTFEMIDRLEGLLGRPQYFEWALTTEGSVKNWMLQISDADFSRDFYDFSDFGTPLLEANMIVGSGVRDCSKLATIFNQSDLDNLYRFNQANSGYILLFAKGLIRPDLRFMGDRLMEFKHYSNASVLIERSIHSFTGAHTGTPVSHLGGQIEAAGMFFGVVNERGEVPFDYRTLMDSGNEMGLSVYPNPEMKVVANPMQDRMVIYK